MVELQSESNQESMGTAGYERAKATFDVGRTATEYINLYTKMET